MATPEPSNAMDGRGVRVSLCFVDCQIDPRRQELRRGGEIVHIEPQVYDLLLHLVRNRDRIVSKDELLDTIWNGRIVSESALSSRINAARKAIGDDGDRQVLIRTIHRRGFRFVGEVNDLTANPTDAAKAGPRPPATSLNGHDPAGPPQSERPEPAASSRKPSIAVMPFTNLNIEPDSDYFSYSLTEDVIRLLARNRWLDVLSRHSAAAFQGQDIDPRAVGAALGVRYLVRGTVLKLGPHMRISADLISAANGHHLWGESYQAPVEEILDIQNTMARQIAAVIEPELARLEREAAVRRPPDNLDAWDYYQRGLWNMWAFTMPRLAEGETMFRRAIELDPAFARAHGALAYVTLQNLVLRDPAERPVLLEDALRLGRAAVSLDDQDSMNLCVVGRVLCFRREYAEAIAFLEQSIRVNPSFAQGYFALGFTLIVSGRAAEAIGHLERAVELSPRDPHLASFHGIRAIGHLALAEWDNAETFARRAIRIPNTTHWPAATLIALLGLLDRSAEAAPAVKEMLEKYPDYSVTVARDDFFFCDDAALVERFLDGLRRAGIPELTAARNAPGEPKLARAAF
jgi:TolB-like protein/DNA-binding winged helix-turn-helix (wHTH) protein